MSATNERRPAGSPLPDPRLEVLGRTARFRGGFDDGFIVSSSTMNSSATRTPQIANRNALVIHPRRCLMSHSLVEAVMSVATGNTNFEPKCHTNARRATRAAHHLHRGVHARRSRARGADATTRVVR